MKKNSKHTTRNPGSKTLRQFVEWCVSAKGSCGESDIRAFVCDAYKREYVLRYAAKDMARLAQRDNTKPENNAGVKFLSGVEISAKEIESLYTRGVSRVLNDIKTCGRRQRGGVAFCSATKQFSIASAKECHAN
jgi:hypothetical protein